MFVQAAQIAEAKVQRQGSGRRTRLNELQDLRLELEDYAKLYKLVDIQIKEIRRRDGDVESLVMLEHAATNCLRNHTRLKQLITTFRNNTKPRIDFYSKR